MPELRRDGLRLWYTVDGPDAAPALLLCNSLGATLDLWTPQLPALAARFRVIRFDTRGHGRSAPPGGAATLDDLGRDALAVLDAAGAARAHVCGISLGGQVAMWLGLHAPERVDRLVLAATGARIATAADWQARIDAVFAHGLGPVADTAPERWFTAAFRAAHAATVARCQEALRAASPEGYAACCAALRDADLREAVAGLRAPALVVAGAADPATPPALLRDLAARIPGARLAELPAAHLVNVEAAAAFTGLVQDFLGG
jgi:3-oxoadipate enol-lactonase